MIPSDFIFQPDSDDIFNVYQGKNLYNRAVTVMADQLLEYLREKGINFADIDGKTVVIVDLAGIKREDTELSKSDVWNKGYEYGFKLGFITAIEQRGSI